tara:strand:- start:1602 stop:1805 length:204 start_codon:yes stop_codon:yes gene_type:complete
VCALGPIFEKKRRREPKTRSLKKKLFHRCMLKNRFFSLSVNLFLRRQKEIDAQKRATEAKKKRETAN